MTTHGQGAKEKERIREENERIKTKERELKEAEEVRVRRLAMSFVLVHVYDSLLV